MFPVIALVASALLVSTVDAHGRLGLPAPTFIPSSKGKEHFAPYGVYGAKNPPAASYAGSMSASDQQKREQTFTTNFKRHGFASLRQWITDNQVAIQYDGRPSGGTPQCGYSDPNGKPQALPMQLQWGSPAFQHPGPCEAWCDNEIVVPYQASCNGYVKNGNLDYDRAKCAGKRTLTFYYVATHVAEPFQVYTNCVPLQGGAGSGNIGGGGAVATNSTTQSTKPKATSVPAPTSSPAKPKAATASGSAKATSKPPPKKSQSSKCRRRGA